MILITSGAVRASLLTLAALAIVVPLLAQSPRDLGRTVDFARDVQPLLREHCYSCHGPTQQMQGLRLDRRRDAMAIGLRRVIFPGESANSRLYQRISGNTPGVQMPPTGSLSPEQISLLKTWIDQGAEWPDELSGDRPRSQPDPRAARIMDALRDGDGEGFRKALRSDPSAINLKGTGGSTPLMYAALYGDVESMQRLLEAGADPNVENDAGATALMWATDDVSKTRRLVARGANVNAISADSHTPLSATVVRPGSSPVISYLLESGATLSGRGAATWLMLAARTGDDTILKTLIANGVDVRNSRHALMYAVRVGCLTCVDLLIDAAVQADLDEALTEAGQAGDVPLMKRLLDRHADVNASITVLPANRLPFNVLMASSFSEVVPTDAIRLLIERGADVKRRNAGGDSALDFASRNGPTPIVDLLRTAGASGREQPGASSPASKRAGSIRAAVERSLPLLQRSDATFTKKAGCVSCHHNSLTAITVESARRQGLRVDESIARRQAQVVASYIESARERVLQGEGIPGLWNTIGYILTGMAAEQHPPDPSTDALARYLKNTQLTDGRWFNLDGRYRPPVDSSDVQVTAMAIRALRVYAPRPYRAEYQRAVARAADWLSTATPQTMEDRAFQLMGLTWSGGHQDAIHKAARELRALQRPDGGWAQIPSLSSDAYATGQALVALTDSRSLALDDPARVRGVRYLMETQLEDGSWYVKSRALAIMPYFESDFPHGVDQFISAAATNWATLALIPVSERR